MQFLWTYIDDIVGKGAGFLLLTELIGYLSISLFPMALPIAVLISSVMVMGNLAERYELASFKSAGVPLLRIMLPLMFVTIGISYFSFLCSNYMIPYANLKFKSRLYDIRKQKPTLSLEEGVFNDDFQGFVIRIADKEADNRSIKDVLIYDHNNKQDKVSIITAKDGEMYTTADKQYFVMNLKNGNQYQENKTTSSKKNSYPFIRTSFKEWNKVFDLREFEMKSTDEELFKSHQTMLSIAQLRVAVDSIYKKIDRRKEDLASYHNRFFHFRKELNKTVKVKKPSAISSKKATKKDEKKEEKKKKNKKDDNNSDVKRKQYKNKGLTPPKQKINKKLNEYDSFIETFLPQERKKIYSKAQTTARSIHSQAISTKRNLLRINESRVKHIYELHMKYSMAVVCFIFLFIGAPMGAIVRKGGFGYPILIAIFFFMIFMVLTILCDKLAEQFVVPAVLSAWIPCAVLFPVGLFLTYRAMNDSKIINIDRITAFFTKLFSKFAPANKTLAK